MVIIPYICQKFKNQMLHEMWMCGSGKWVCWHESSSKFTNLIIKGGEEYEPKMLLYKISMSLLYMICRCERHMREWTGICVHWYVILSCMWEVHMWISIIVQWLRRQCIQYWPHCLAYPFPPQWWCHLLPDLLQQHGSLSLVESH